MATSGITFPVELCRPVANLLVDDQRALYHLGLASRVFKHEAERILYHRFRSKDIEHHKAFLTAITLSEEHALLVNTYGFIPDCPLDMELRDLMKLALKAMKNLKLFTFRPPSQSPIVPVTDLLSSCAFQLIHFDWAHPGTEVYLVPFLESQVSLRSVHLISDFNPTEGVQIHPDALPNLNQVGGDEKVLEFLLPGRSVRKVRWMGSTSSEPSAALLDSLRGIQILVLPLPNQYPPLPVLAPYLENVEVLKFVILDPQDQLETQFVHMPRLKHLVLCLHLEMWGTISLSAKKTMIKRLYDNSKSLIDVETSDGRHNKDGAYLFERWDRAAKKPTAAFKSPHTGWNLVWK